MKDGMTKSFGNPKLLYKARECHEVIRIVCRGPNWLTADSQEGAPWTSRGHPHPAPHGHTSSSRRQDEIVLGDVSPWGSSDTGPPTGVAPPRPGQASYDASCARAGNQLPG